MATVVLAIITQSLDFGGITSVNNDPGGDVLEFRTTGWLQFLQFHGQTHVAPNLQLSLEECLQHKQRWDFSNNFHLSLEECLHHTQCWDFNNNFHLSLEDYLQQCLEDCQ